MGNKKVQNLPPKTGNFYDADGNTFNIVDILTGDMPVKSLVNGKPQGTPFGIDMVVATENPNIASKWDMGIDIRGIKAEIVGDAFIQVTPDETTVEFHTGNEPNSYLLAKSDIRIRYGPGKAIYAKYTAGWPAPEDSNGDYTVAIGFNEGVEGMMQAQRRRDGVVKMGFLYVTRGTMRFIEANGDGQGNLSGVLSPEEYVKLPIFYFLAGYLGSLPTEIYWRDTTERIFKQYHYQRYDNEDETSQGKYTNIRTPDLPVSVLVMNEGNTNDLVFRNGSFEAGIINGSKTYDVSARIWTYEDVQTVDSAVDGRVFAFRNPTSAEMYDSVDITAIPTTRSFTNTISSQLLELQFSADGNNKDVRISVYVGSTEAIVSGTYAPIDLGYSVVEVSDDMVIDLNHPSINKVENLLLKSGSDAKDKLITTLDLLSPDQVAFIAYTTTSASFTLTSFLKAQDLF